MTDDESFQDVFARGLVFGAGIFIGFALLYGLVLGGTTAVDAYGEQCSPEHTVEVHYTDGNTSDPMVYLPDGGKWESPWYCLGGDDYEQWNGTGERE
ncbi:hypothetical protein [Halopiger xanaduensis]|uniref:Uncharacterized protein n=1 Tax=Halopiger xanaduensis (strain DSM 18323 / JCM 14033 / SH-6) TaxID=797210 RepID=F8DER5_HALXS|nr:hypothetical protein [Halopiger xanaduensis]AEH39505.1 hypothetical protein Halxa_0265 [Halopiger xanaduensis SH-6]